MAVDNLINKPGLIHLLREQAHASTTQAELSFTLLQGMLARNAVLPHHLDDFGKRMNLTRQAEIVTRLQKETRLALQALTQSLQGLGLVSTEELEESELPPLNGSELLALYKYLIQIVRALEPRMEKLMDEVSQDPDAVLELGRELLEPRDVTETELSELFALLQGA
jgi:hypothetical protein